MTCVLVGPMCSGKTTTAKLLEKSEIQRIVTYTTRQPRKGEKDGIDYHFVSDQTFLDLQESGIFAETTEYKASFGHVYYGSTVSSYYSEKPNVIVLNPRGVKTLVDTIPRNRLYVVYLDVDFDRCRERAIRRGDKIEEIERRLAADAEDFKSFSESGLWNLRLYGDKLSEFDMKSIVAIMKKHN